ncbi:hypothetical protein CRYUN_Cryun39dG0027500 [Craigia yunnanensis]
MASQVSQVLASPFNGISSNMENRPKADFHPGIWGDVFLNCPDKWRSHLIVKVGNCPSYFLFFYIFFT